MLCFMQRTNSEHRNSLYNTRHTLCKCLRSLHFVPIFVFPLCVSSILSVILSTCYCLESLCSTRPLSRWGELMRRPNWLIGSGPVGSGFLLIRLEFPYSQALEIQQIVSPLRRRQSGAGAVWQHNWTKFLGTVLYIYHMIWISDLIVVKKKNILICF